jgi:hypothetical protein
LKTFEIQDYFKYCKGANILLMKKFVTRTKHIQISPLFQKEKKEKKTLNPNASSILELKA